LSTVNDIPETGEVVIVVVIEPGGPLPTLNPIALVVKNALGSPARKPVTCAVMEVTPRVLLDAGYTLAASCVSVAEFVDAKRVGGEKDRYIPDVSPIPVTVTGVEPPC
jgi:hypothetical protein